MESINEVSPSKELDRRKRVTQWEGYCNKLF